METSRPLQIGAITHLLIHHYNVQTLDLTDLDGIIEMVQDKYPDEERYIIHDIVELSITLLKAYVRKAEEKAIIVVASEMHVETEEPDFFIYGRVDGLGRTQDGRLWRRETKTTSKMDSLFLSGLKTGLQSGIYHHLLQQTLKEDIHGTIFELLVKTKTPYCELAPVPVNKLVIDRSLETFRGVARSIARGDFYPSSRCAGYNRECDYFALCNHPTEKTKQAFYKKREIR